LEERLKNFEEKIHEVDAFRESLAEKETTYVTSPEQRLTFDGCIVPVAYND